MKKVDSIKIEIGDEDSFVKYSSGTNSILIKTEKIDRGDNSLVVSYFIDGKRGTTVLHVDKVQGLPEMLSMLIDCRYIQASFMMQGCLDYVRELSSNVFCKQPELN